MRDIMQGVEIKQAEKRRKQGKEHDGSSAAEDSPMAYAGHVPIDECKIVGGIGFGQGLDTSRRKTEAKQLVHEKLNRVEKGIQSDTGSSQKHSRKLSTHQGRQDIDCLGCTENAGTFDDGSVGRDLHKPMNAKRDNRA